MKIGVWHPDKYVLSVQIYYEHVRQALEGRGVHFLPFGRTDDLPGEADIFWDPTCTGGKHPNRRFKNCGKPLIVTVHGASNLSLPLRLNFPKRKERMKGVYENLKKRSLWKWMRPDVSEIITVSNYARDEIREFLSVGDIPVTPIYHGYDRKVFQGEQRKPDEFATYFFHVSVYQPKKNVDRILEAYEAIIGISRIPLILVVPGYPRKLEIEGVKLIRNRIGRVEVANYLKEASGFVFPSLHESFGIPLVEALACACPVITSNMTACPEIVGDAGICVDPYSVESLRDAMIQLMSDAPLRAEMSARALQRASHFSWEQCAEEHYRVFRRAMDNRS